MEALTVSREKGSLGKIQRMIVQSFATLDTVKSASINSSSCSSNASFGTIPSDLHLI